MKLPRVICAKYSDLYDNICIEIIRNPAFGLDFFILYLFKNNKIFISYVFKRERKFLYYTCLNGKVKFLYYVYLNENVPR